jgi:hypothetical protein
MSSGRGSDLLQASAVTEEKVQVHRMVPEKEPHETYNVCKPVWKRRRDTRFAFLPKRSTRLRSLHEVEDVQRLQTSLGNEEPRVHGLRSLHGTG